MATELQVIHANLLPEASNITDADMILIIQSGRPKRALPSAMKGERGDNVYMGLSDTHILWKIGMNGSWQNLIAIESLRGKQGYKPVFRKVAGTLQEKYENEDDSAYVNIFEKEELKLRFSDLTAEEVEQLKLHFGDLTAEDIAVLQQPATEAAAEVREAAIEWENEENVRKSNEAERTADETARQTAEDNRATAEAERIESENLRAESEITRQQAEASRIANESNREASETERQTNELQRQSNTATAIGNAEAATTSANEAAAKANDAAIAANTAAENITRKEVPTLESAPTEETVSYVNSKGDTIQFYIGDECRVMENGEYTFYKLYDLVDGVASWDEIGSGLSLTRNLYLQSANYYNESVQIVREGDTL